MGDPRRIKKKFSGPRHPWQSSRLEVERKLLDDYGLKTKRELWKVSSELKSYAGQAKRLIAAIGSQSDREKSQLFQRLKRLGLVGDNPQLDNVLDLKVTSLLDRRLQTIIFRRGLARSMRQARQFITHRHIIVGGRQIVTPSYIVPVGDESSISFVSSSALVDAGHPERVSVKEDSKKLNVESKNGKSKVLNHEPESVTRKPVGGGAL